MRLLNRQDAVSRSDPRLWTWILLTARLHDAMEIAFFLTYLTFVSLSHYH